MRKLVNTITVTTTSVSGVVTKVIVTIDYELA